MGICINKEFVVSTPVRKGMQRELGEAGRAERPWCAPDPETRRETRRGAWVGAS